MGAYEGLRQSRWECKYHVIFIPKCRRKKLCASLRHWASHGFWA